MKVALEWLREFVPIALSPRELADVLTLVGLAVDRVDGDVLDLDLTSNRPDCLSHYGVAREIAAATQKHLAPLALRRLQPRQSVPVPIALDSPACGRYCALVLEDVTVRPSPPAIASRLEALGHRAINNIADLTNYTLWEMGHPTHAFDLDQLRGGEIRVRWARPGETLVTLDGIERKLTPEDLVIADAVRPVALAGVMGGLETSITAATRRVLLESAWFDPLAVRRSARRHGLHTDASHRFERGADPAAAPLAAWRIAARALDYGARLAAGLTDAAGPIPQRLPIELRSATIKRILGSVISPRECRRTLQALGCTPYPAPDATPTNAAAGRSAPLRSWLPPSWRPDLFREIDLIEEIARLHGYQNFPARLPALQGWANPLPHAALRDRVRHQLRGRGFAETLALSFAAEPECARFAPAAAPVRLLNPLSEEAAILRTSCVPAMLHALAHNLNHGAVAPRLYEIGKTYQLRGAKPAEAATLTLACADSAFDFPALKGEVEAVLAAFDLAMPEATPDAPAYYHPGRSARLGAWAVLGQLHPAVTTEWKLPAHLWLAEIALDPLYALGPRPVNYHPPSRYPASTRDFSFLFQDEVTWARIRAALHRPPLANLVAITPVEIFRDSAKLGHGRYSLLLRAQLQNQERTLRDDEIATAAAEIIRRLELLGGSQR